MEIAVVGLGSVCLVLSFMLRRKLGYVLFMAGMVVVGFGLLGFLIK